jgi:Protein of unknown function (DUF2510)
MTNTSGPTTPAGWYPDPVGSANLRWWDGATWTAHLAPPPTPAPTPPPEPYVPFQNSWTSSSPGNSYGGAPTGEFARPAQWNTGAAWFLALSQLITLVAIVALFAVDGATIASTGVLPTTQTLTLATGAIEIGVFLLSVLLAVMDRRKLQSFGYLQLASVWWILLAPPLAYLIVRGIAVSREVRHGFGPLVAYIITTAVVVLLGVGTAVAIPVYLASHEGAGSWSGTDFAADLQKGLDHNGGNYTVVCPRPFRRGSRPGSVALRPKSRLTPLTL